MAVFPEDLTALVSARLIALQLRVTIHLYNNPLSRICHVLTDMFKLDDDDGGHWARTGARRDAYRLISEIIDPACPFWTPPFGSSTQTHVLDSSTLEYHRHGSSVGHRYQARIWARTI